MSKEDFVEIEGVKYQADPDKEGEALLDDEGKMIPFDDGEKGEIKGGGKDPGKTLDDISNASIADLAKLNPGVAEILAEKKEVDKRLADIEAKEDERRRKEAESRGEWQKLADEETKKREDAERKLEDSKQLLTKYVGSVKTILEEVIATIPKENRGLIPDNFSPRQKLEYITKNAKLLGAKIVGAKGGPIDKSDKDVNVSDEDKLVAEIEELMKKENKTQQEYALLTEKATELKRVRAKKQLKE